MSWVFQDPQDEETVGVFVHVSGLDSLLPPEGHATYSLGRPLGSPGWSPTL